MAVDRAPLGGEDGDGRIGHDLGRAGVPNRFVAAQALGVGHRSGGDGGFGPQAVGGHGAAEFVCPAEGQDGHAELAQRIGGEVTQPSGLQVHRRRQREHVRVVRLGQVRQRGLNQGERAAGIDVHHEVVALERQHRRGAEIDRAGVVDHHVDAPELRDGRFHETLDVVVGTNVADVGQHSATGLADGFGSGVNGAGDAGVRLGGLGHDGDVRAMTGRGERNLEADAARATGHQQDLPGEGIRCGLPEGQLRGARAKLVDGGGRFGGQCGTGRNLRFGHGSRLLRSWIVRVRRTVKPALRL